MRAIASFEVVCETADALVVDGVEPTILAVQERIGGGSFTTVKKHLTAWAELRAKEAAATPTAPAELLGKAQDFGRALWAMAVAHAQIEVRQVKDAAQAEVAVLKKELAEAISELVRLEGVETKLTEALEANQKQLRRTELARVEAQTMAAQVPKLENALTEAQAELTRKAAEMGRLAGELEALQRRVKDK